MSMLSEVVFCWVILLLAECSLSSSCSDEGTSSAIEVNITCDSYLQLYVDGIFLGGGVTNVKSLGFLGYEIKAGSHMVALSCKGSTQSWKGEFWVRLITDWLPIPLGNAPQQLRTDGI
ncbi:hypothetical protein OS493_019893 [Desmophyllum pertusum]|uniref:Uncharacterized protein n=1 Tax=Desmophyllum pertusum TaxID=174260 RepID=A0A9W9YMX9_9CNID|nr:hypothetical protein OS493_019893 [Desmophyllum pertusum]